MRVVWISHGVDARGGAELAIVEGSEALASQGADVHVVLPTDGPLNECLTTMGCPTTVIRHTWWVWAGEASLRQRLRHRTVASSINIVAVPRVAALLRRLRPDVVVTNTLAIPVGAAAAKLVGIPHVWYIHEFGWEDHRFGFILGERTSLSLVDRLSTLVLVNSDAVRTKFASHPMANKLRRVYCAVNVPSYLDDIRVSSSQGLRLVHIGRPTPGKGHEDAIRAVALLKQRGLDVSLRLVGASAAGYDRRLEALKRHLDVSDRVQLVGFRSDPFPEIRAADVALVCSRNEAFGRVTVEAMKLGRPVIGARAGGTIELISDGWNGLFYEPGHSEQLANRIDALYHDPEKLLTLGCNAADWARSHFTAEMYGLELLAVFEESINASATQ